MNPSGRVGFPQMAAHPDIQSEQAHIDRAYARVEAMRAAAAARRQEVLANGRGGTHQAREERDVIVRSSLAREEQLKLGSEALVFGRVDQLSGDAFHIGRLAVSDDDQEPLVVDWRAPVAEPFYRATGRVPMGLVRRRHFVTEGARIIGIEDEILDIDAAEQSDLVGESALLAALERSRSGTMRDIVATIQAEQDDIIRAPLPGVLVVQGGPGTGKTAVALHRAAYLLYTHRFPLERQGVLVIGPNPLFLRYIEHVLPSLGETGVTLSTISGLYQQHRPVGVDRPLAARVKGDVRMAKVVARAVQDRQRGLRADLRVPYGAYSLRLSAAASADIVQSVKRRPGPHNARRRQVEGLVLRRLFEQLELASDRAARTGLRESPAEMDFEDFAEDVRHLPEVRLALDRMWPLLLPEELLHDLYGARALIELAGRRWLDEAERKALRRSRSESLEAISWTVADVALLDEASVLLGPRRRRRPDDPPLIRTFGHVVVDEAQDLTPMQLRMVARRSLAGSMTIVGDIGQATGPRSPDSWDDVLSHLPARKPSRLVELTVNYRTPLEIMEVANRVLAAAAPHLRPPTSVRSGGRAPDVRLAADPRELAETSRAEAVALQEEIGGTVAVIAPASLVGLLTEAVGAATEVRLEAPVSVIGVAAVKGLEFDGVVLVEPAAVAAESAQGLRALYVALTRATKRLVVVHTEPLPEVLELTSAGQDPPPGERP